MALTARELIIWKLSQENRSGEEIASRAGCSRQWVYKRRPIIEAKVLALKAFAFHQAADGHPDDIATLARKFAELDPGRFGPRRRKSRPELAAA